VQGGRPCRRRASRPNTYRYTKTKFVGSRTSTDTRRNSLSGVVRVEREEPEKIKVLRVSPSA